jgi:1-acyl-sn-glycerol-3-phosphate acyltransferase
MSAERTGYSPIFSSESVQHIDGIVPALRAAQITNDALLRAFVSRIDVVNPENLAYAFNFRFLRRRIIWMGNHLSNFDAPVLWRTLRNAGFCDTKTAPVFPVGKRLLDNPRTRPFTRFIDAIPVWPPTEPPKSTDERRQLVEINTRAFKTAEEVLRSGRSIALFPEATRSRTKILQKGYAANARYLMLPQKANNNGEEVDTVIMPFTLSNTEVIYPIGQSLPHTRGPVGIAFMKPILTSELRALYGHLPKIEMQQMMIDHVMIEIARGLPREKRGYYADRV